MFKLFAVLILSASITTSVSADTNDTSTAPTDEEINLLNTLFNTQAAGCSTYPFCDVIEANAIKQEESDEKETYSEPANNSSQQPGENE